MCIISIAVLGSAYKKIDEAIHHTYSKSAQIQYGIKQKYNEIKGYNEEQMQKLLFNKLGFYRIRMDMKTLQKVNKNKPLSVLKPIVARYMFWKENGKYLGDRKKASNLAYLIYNPTYIKK